MPTEKPRYTITVDPDLQTAIENYQFDNRFKSQTKAIVSLMELGLEKLKNEPPAKQEMLSDGETILLQHFRALNAEGKEKALDYIEDLAEMDKYKNDHQSQMVEKNA